MADDICTDLTAAAASPSEPIDIGEDFTACLPFGGSITLASGKLSYKAPSAPSVTEGYVVVSGGCISDVKAVELPTYTSAPCAPVPSRCDDSGGGGGGGGGDCSDCLTQVVAQGGTSISVTGAGTSSSPLIISYTGKSGSSTITDIVSGNSAITVGSSGSAAVITHKTGKGGTFNGLTFDEFGHLTGGSGSSGGGLIDVVGGDGIDVTSSGGVAIVSLIRDCAVDDGTYYFGGYRIVYSSCKITEIERAITLPPGTYNMGGYAVGVNAYGSINSLTRSIQLTPQTVTLGAYDVTVDGYGSITNIQPSSSTGGGTSTVYAWVLFDRGSALSPSSSATRSFSLMTNSRVLVRLSFYDKETLAAIAGGTGDIDSEIAQKAITFSISGNAFTTYTQAPGLATYVPNFTLTAGQHTIEVRSSGVCNGPVTLEVVTVNG